MSHITKVATQFKELGALTKAVEALGGEFVEGAKQFVYYSGARSECDHKIKFKNASYEIGVVKNKDGAYDLKLDYFSSGGLKPIVGQGCSRLKIEYGVAATTMKAERKGFRVIREEHEGRPRLRAFK
jgi:hypothetical protein